MLIAGISHIVIESVGICVDRGRGGDKPTQENCAAMCPLYSVGILRCYIAPQDAHTKLHVCMPVHPMDNNLPLLTAQHLEVYI